MDRRNEKHEFFKSGKADGMHKVKKFTQEDCSEHGIGQIFWDGKK